MSELSIQDELGELVDGQAEFDADLAYLRSLAGAIFEHAAPQDLMRIAAFDAANA